MATGSEFAAFVQEQLGGEADGVCNRKMFGEYGVFRFGKMFAVICDNTLFIKPTPAGEAMLQSLGLLQWAPPYVGAKDYFRVDELDDTAMLRTLRDVTLSAIPEPKPKKPKRNR